MNDSKRLLILVLGGALVVALAAIFQEPAKADTGSEGATRIERGSYAAMRKVAVSSTTGTALWSASRKRPDGLCYNNSSTTIWVGTVTATMNGKLHSNITEGFPLLSSSTFRLDGSFTGALAATCDVEVTACELRCLDGLVQ